MTHIFPFLEAIGQHRDKLQSIKLHVDFGCCSHAVFDYNPRGYEAMRRTLSLLFSSKPLLMLSLDTGWVCYDEIGDNLMANGFDWLWNIVESRGDRIHDNCKADQGKANVRRGHVSSLSVFCAHGHALVPYPDYGPNGPRNQHFGHRPNPKPDV
jgi:hypothetical protein